MQKQDLSLFFLCCGLFLLTVLGGSFYYEWRKKKVNPLDYRLGNLDWTQKTGAAMGFAGAIIFIIAGIIGPCNR